MSEFNLHSPWEPAGDQPQAIEELTEGVQHGDKFQTLLGITGSGKTRTVAGVIENVQKPTLVMSHNKTLAAQLYRELSDFYPENRVEFFISYYDYYQPEAYISTQDKYIEKDLSINEEIQRLRLRATSSLLSGRRDVIIVSSVSCIYGIGSPSEYEKLIINLETGIEIPRNTLLYDLVDLHYNRNDLDFTRGTFRVRGDVVDVYPAYSEEGLRVSFWGDEIENLEVFDVDSGEVLDQVNEFRIYPASHYVTSQGRLEEAIEQIREEMHWRVEILQDEQRFLEAKRLEQRTLFDIEMMQEIGYCSGIENYSRYLSARKPGERPYCLMDYFPDDYLLVVDESHQTVPQIGAMYGGDRSRKVELVEHGFRLPSALDNRPLTFEEWEGMINQAIFVSATPSDYELEQSGGVYVEQIIRPTGLMEPEIEVRPLGNQVDDLLEEIRIRAEKNERVLCITLTKRLSEELSEYLKNLGISAAYMHSELDAMQRVEVLYKFRRGDFNVLVGINLLREGIDIPELSLVAIMDADKEGFLRSETSLFQIVGRAARNVGGKAILYADKITNSIQKVVDETNRRRKIQKEYNEKHGITPQTVKKELKPLVDPSLISTQDFTLDPKKEDEEDYLEVVKVAEDGIQYKANPAMKEVTFESKEKFLEYLRDSMLQAAKNMEFEEAARIRDQIAQLEEEL
ncbi:excinuclease ABC subunit UvrB [Rhodohalobacter sulfatireducens]|uniref:UvrABC system protein B n=1 Tax=Rhodohalobacter sulfatireducens TaxID=2911366 RepID=A0ABS9KA06_9BACT|nr:excinuclease ABC subunit UvrB [Rhodohalobacter sulfatireducens]MCG2587676.1 excinuclease ABC subunit UvrB [Rhodohalobacter sulfatireducens]MDR9365511.1 excinuclease ABC subunit UvrB [Balneolaceae bacterium]MDR9407687.1 excinuclease ABC subunit UvrB [Balneolaceae bacterium]